MSTVAEQLRVAREAQGLTVQQMKDLALEWVQPANTGAPGGGLGGSAATHC